MCIRDRPLLVYDYLNCKSASHVFDLQFAYGLNMFFGLSIIALSIFLIVLSIVNTQCKITNPKVKKMRKYFYGLMLVCFLAFNIIFLVMFFGGVAAGSNFALILEFVVYVFLICLSMYALIKLKGWGEIVFKKPADLGVKSDIVSRLPESKRDKEMQLEDQSERMIGSSNRGLIGPAFAGFMNSLSRPSTADIMARPATADSLGMFLPGGLPEPAKKVDLDETFGGDANGRKLD
eukprot:TRINITY_DN2469_c0_g1_i2.p1 TRINITY_DN2469_c0_g1~~TRINITY_DN2469_c0_g1_i2.p1  ORF type:complete len:234 (+),score=61.82 TRINITY_DN2469_c0_g1_i2:64-765(+)